MKRVKYVLTIVSITAVLVAGCGKTSTTPAADKTQETNTEDTTQNQVDDAEDAAKTSDAKTVEIGNDYSTSSNIDFSLFKIITSNKLECLGGGSLYYEADSGYNFADVVLEITNNDSSEFSARDGINAFFESGDGTRYDNTLIAIESSGDNLDQFGSIKPLATDKVHIGYKIPVDVTSGKAYFGFGDDLFVVDYDSSSEVSNKTSIKMNQEVVVDDVASFKLLGTDFTADVLPPNTSGFYTHYEVDDPSNDIYFVVYCDLANNSSSSIRADDMISIRAIFDGKYEYNCNMALEAKDGEGFDYANITSIDPLESRKGVFMFEVPKKVQDMDYELSLYFYGNEYSYSK